MKRKLVWVVCSAASLLSASCGSSGDDTTSDDLDSANPDVLDEVSIDTRVDDTNDTAPAFDTADSALDAGIDPDVTSTDSGSIDAADSSDASDSTSTDVATVDSVTADSTDAGCSATALSACGTIDTDCDGIADETEGRAAARDTDSDGVADYLDLDSDGDSILDQIEWRVAGCAVAPNDADGDGAADPFDGDSDGDAVGDACEARASAAPTAADLSKPVLDTDADGVADYLDLDTDGDYISDGKEDLDHDCLVGATETSRIAFDSDGDGASDLAESVVPVGSSGLVAARDAAQTPAKARLVVFVVPYAIDGSVAVSPPTSYIGVTPKVRSVDLGFVIDTTGSMAEEVAGLKAGLTAIRTSLASVVPDLAMGLSGYEDFPVSGYGGSTSVPFYVAPRATTTKTGTMTTDGPTLASAVSTLGITSGGDDPEATVPAMLRALSGKGYSYGTLASQILPDLSPVSGQHGAMQFRDDALSLLVPITDAAFHNGRRALTLAPPRGSTSMTDYTTFVDSPYAAPVVAANVDALVTAMVGLGARLVGVASTDSTHSLSSLDPYPYLAYLGDKTSSFAVPSAFGGSSCDTGKAGAAASPDGPSDATTPSTCRMVFTLNTSDGTDLSRIVVAGTTAMVRAWQLKLFLRASSTDKDPLDASKDAVDLFVTSVAPRPTGGTDPSSGSACKTIALSRLLDEHTSARATLGAGDVAETVGDVVFGDNYCFDLTPKRNTAIPSTATPQVFHVDFAPRIDVVGATANDRTANWTATQAVFIVPPALK